MSALPKLPSSTRAEIARIASRKRRLTKLIARLQDVKRQMPSAPQIAKQLNVSENVVRRTINGHSYKNRHPQDANQSR